MPRQAYDIRFRCTLNGCDWTARVFLPVDSPCIEVDAFDAMYKRLGFGSGSGEGRNRYSRHAYRVVSCDVSPDQSRPVQ